MTRHRLAFSKTRSLRLSFVHLLVIAGVQCATAAAASFDCVIEPSLRLKLAAPVSGVLKDVAVDRGSAIRKGQVVAKLETAFEEASLALDKARAKQDVLIEGRRARVDFLQRKQARLKELAIRNLATPAVLDETATDLHVAQTELFEAQRNAAIALLEVSKQRTVVQQKSVISPIDGLVVERNLFAGEYAYEQAPIMTIAQIDPLKVDVYLPTIYFRSVAVGDTVQVQPEAPIGGVYAGVVDVIDTVMDSRSGTFGLRLNLPNSTHQLPAGLRCHAHFAHLPQETVLTSPAVHD